MTFVATDCLSELVWSPNSGLSLKCTVAGVPETRNSFFCGIGPSDMVLLSSHSVEEGSFCEKVIEEREVHESLLNYSVAKVEGDGTTFSSASETCAGDVKTWSFGTDTQERTKGLEEGQSVNLSTKPNAFHPNEGHAVPMVTNLDNVNKSDSVGEQGVNAQVHPVCPVRGGFLSEPHAQFTRDDNDSLMLSQPSRCKEILDADKSVEEERLNEPFTRERLECTGENELRSSCDVILKSVVDLRKDSKKQSVELDNCDPVIKASPIRALVSSGKGKEKALSDGDMLERASEDGDDSNASVESCNSAGLIAGKRKQFLSFEQQLIGGTKRIKGQSHGNLNSMPSVTKCNSSFTNWISMMIKGLSNPKPENAPSLILPLAENSLGNHSQCSKDQYRSPSNMGFQSVFRSLYTATSEFLDQGLPMPGPCNQLEGCKELDVVNNPCEAAGPISPPYDLEPVKDIAGLGQSPDRCTVGDADDPLVDRNTWKEKFPAPMPSCKTDVSASPIMCSSLEKVPVVARGPESSRNSAFVKLKSDDSGDDNVCIPPEEKLVGDTIKKDPLSSLWVTRLCSKACSPTENSVKSKQTVHRCLDPGNGDPRVINTQSNVHFLQNLNVVEEHKEHLAEEPSSSAYKKLQSCALGFEAHTTVDRIEVQKVADPDLPPQNLTISEDMTSIFAKRLDAFRQMSPSNNPENEAVHSRTCLFCGVKGHDLQDCTQLFETELAELMRNISAYGGAEESLCLCIRCFELNHWAIACPNIASKKACQLDTSEHGHSHSSDTRNLFGFRKAHDLLGSMNHRILELKEKTAASSKGSFKNPNAIGILSVGLEMNAASTSMEWVRTSSPQRPKDIFEAIKKLRLSRSDILKYLTAPSLNSRLNGYYLRLRLGKWERGLRGTGYYVACIVGSRGANKSLGGRGDLIPVMVRGMRCLVESHNISNQEFLEDELMAWWSGLLRDGGKIPSEDDLRLKWEERKRLGL